MTRELQPVGQSALEWAAIKTMAQDLLASGFLPQHIRRPAEAVAIIQAGRELGLGPMAALRSLYIIDGKIEMSTQLMLALAQRTGELEDFKVQDEKDTCAVTVKRRGRTEISVRFTAEDARRQGLKGRNWETNPRVMLRWRAISEALRLVFPDALLGIYSPGEISGDEEVAQASSPDHPTDQEPVPAVGVIPVGAEPVPPEAATSGEPEVEQAQPVQDAKPELTPREQYGRYYRETSTGKVYLDVPSFVADLEKLGIPVQKVRDYIGGNNITQWLAADRSRSIEGLLDAVRG